MLLQITHQSGSSQEAFVYVVGTTGHHKLDAKQTGLSLASSAYFECLHYCYVFKSIMWFCFTGTGTNVCYMEELKNIEKTKNTEKMEKEERMPEEKDNVKVL